MPMKYFNYFGKARNALYFFQGKGPSFIAESPKLYTGNIPLVKPNDKKEQLIDENNSARKTRKTKSPAIVAPGDGHPSIDLSFQNCREAYKSKRTLEIFRAYCVLSLCSVNTLVNHNKWVCMIRISFVI